MRWQPIVEVVSRHESFAGYYVYDEPQGAEAQHLVNVSVEALRLLDPEHPAFPVLIGWSWAPSIFASAQPDVFLADIYPYGSMNASCDTTLSGFGYPWTFREYADLITAGRGDTPLWLILQTHSFGEVGAPYSLRQPSAVEVRLENWLALSQGSTGIFWFVYSSQQGWVGLKDNRELMSVVAEMSARIQPHSEYLLRAGLVSDHALWSSGDLTVFSDGESTRLLVLNTECVERSVWVTGGQAGEYLYDPIAEHKIAFGEEFVLAPGDGVFLVVRKAAQQGWIPLYPCCCAAC